MIANALRSAVRPDSGRHVRLLHAGVLGAVVALLGLLGSAPAGATDLLETRNMSVAFETPAPGHSVEWAMEAENISSGPLEATLAVNEISGTATEGETSLTLSLELPDGTVLASGTARDLTGETFSLAPVQAGETTEILARVELPEAAGNDYRGSDARMRFDVVVTADEGSDSDELSETGAALRRTAVIGLFALLAVLGGLVLVLAKRRKNERGTT